MEFDRFFVAVLVAPGTPPELDARHDREILDGHLNHLATLHEQGKLAAAGPISDGTYHGLSIFAPGVDANEARALTEQDPAVKAGVFAFSIVQWSVPAGAVTFQRTRFPHSAEEAGR